MVTKNVKIVDIRVYVWYNKDVEVLAECELTQCTKTKGNALSKPTVWAAPIWRCFVFFQGKIHLKAKDKRKAGYFMDFSAWKGFNTGDWSEHINVRDFINKNYTAYL